MDLAKNLLYEIFNELDFFSNYFDELYENDDAFDFEKPEEEVRFEVFQQNFYQVCIDVLKELENESFFRNNFPEDVFITFSVSGFEFDNSQVIDMSRGMNNNEHGNDFLKWVEDGYP